MDDRLLTIEDATREYRVGPRTIRRRLSAGRVEGAYKRPSSRGPEWVMPQASLEALGFDRRDETGPGAGAGGDRLRTDVVPVRRRGRVAVLGVLVIAVVAGLVAAVLATAAGKAEAGDPVAGDAVAGVRAVLAALTAPGDAVGLVGAVPPAVLPPERAKRQLAPVDGPVRGPRYVVAVVDGDEAAAVRQLRRSSSLVLDLADGSRSFLVFDSSGASGDEPRDRGGQTDAGEDAMAPAPPSHEEVAVTEPTPTPPAVVALQAAVASPATITVAEGDSFWSIAVDLATAATAGRTPTEAEVVTVWASVVDANRDRLVEPGNPDLLLVGQTLDVGPAR